MNQLIEENRESGVVGAGFLSIPVLKQIILRLNPPVPESGKKAGGAVPNYQLPITNYQLPITQSLLLALGLAITSALPAQAL